MNNCKWTDGPWNNYQGDDIYCVYDSNGKKICSIEAVDIVGWNAMHRDESEANETLIAAAPELYELLQQCKAMGMLTVGYDSGADHKRLCADADRVMAKARRETE